MRTVILFCSLLSLAVAGCTSLSDARGPSEICEVHRSFMRSVEVPGPKSALPVTREYLEAKAKLFPHTYLDFTPDTRNHWMIYICDDCLKAQAAWLKQHPGAVSR
jgi:hypothetical protein